MKRVADSNAVLRNEQKTSHTLYSFAPRGNNLAGQHPTLNADTDPVKAQDVLM